ncbi:MAG: carboxy terminal-processing peptidase [Flavobacteriales bacterium]|nr:carboxy terminal-processing peptidase [Flavobacteriales bacterium]
MKKFLKIAMVLVPAGLISLGFYLKNNDAGEDILMQVITQNLKNYHYEPLDVNDDWSEKAFDHYLEFLDGNKRFLLETDVKDLKKYRKELDDQTQNGTYVFFDESLKIFKERTLQCQEFYQDILRNPFDFELDETVDFGEDQPYAKNEKELKERWRKYLKYSVMTRLSTSMDVEKAKEKDSANTAEIKPFETLEKEAREAVLKTHNEWFERMFKIDRKEHLSTYVNAITSIYDPHTNYFPPADKANFDIRMSGQLEGIGAQLQEKDGYIKVTSIVPGSPSAMQGELQANDLILKVAQGKEEPVDIVNAKIDDAVKLIRGKKGTEVRLTVQKPDGSIKIIPIVRDVVQLEETYAKSVILNDETGKKVGYLYLPSFYADFNGRSGRSSWKDVKAELEKLKANGAEALIFDMRNNGGGSLGDCNEMAGLFLENNGPVVQVKQRNQKQEALEPMFNEYVWDKPVVFMVNEFSASASEILAAAMQDYHRGLIVGSHTTHGKGTVQRMIDLNATFDSKSYPDMGSLKLTMQKFYRINGETTQLKGVTPDIIWADNYTYIKTGEKEEEFSMPYDKISAAKYKVINGNNALFANAKTNSMQRTSTNPLFAEIEKNAHRWEEQNKNEVYTLNLAKYRSETQAKKEVSDAYNAQFKAYQDLVLTANKEDAVSATDTVKTKRVDDWYKGVKKDIYLYETLQIAEDLIK